MQTIRLLLLCLFLISCTSLCQEQEKAVYVESYPTMGWDSMQLMFESHYPEIARRAGIEGFADVYGIVDSIGHLKIRDINTNAELLSAYIHSLIDSTTWVPATRNGVPIISPVHFIVRYLIRNIPHVRDIRRFNVEVDPYDLKKYR